ncbi:MAG: Hint domain-containing protein [Thermoplasmata archaeon]
MMITAAFFVTTAHFAKTIGDATGGASGGLSPSLVQDSSTAGATCAAVSSCSVTGLAVSPESIILIFVEETSAQATPSAVAVHGYSPTLWVSVGNGANDKTFIYALQNMSAQTARVYVNMSTSETYFIEAIDVLGVEGIQTGNCGGSASTPTTALSCTAGPVTKVANETVFTGYAMSGGSGLGTVREGTGQIRINLLESSSSSAGDTNTKSVPFVGTYATFVNTSGATNYASGGAALYPIPTHYNWAGYAGNDVIYPTWDHNGTTLPFLSASSVQTSAQAYGKIANAETLHMSNVSNFQSEYYTSPSPDNFFTLYLIFSATGGSWAFNPADFTTWYQQVKTSVTGLPSDTDTQWTYYDNTGTNVTLTSDNPTKVADEIAPVVEVGLDVAALAFPAISVPIGIWQVMAGLTGVMGLWSDSSHVDTNVYDGSSGYIQQWAAVDNGTYGDCGGCGSSWTPGYDGFNVFGQGVFASTLFAASDTKTLSQGSISVSGCNQLVELQTGACASVGFAIEPAISLHGNVSLYSGGPELPGWEGGMVTLQQDYGGALTDFQVPTTSTGYWHFFAMPGATYTAYASMSDQMGTSAGPETTLPSYTQGSVQGVPTLSADGGLMYGQVTNATSGAGIANAVIDLNNSEGIDIAFNEFYSGSGGYYSIPYPVAASSWDQFTVGVGVLGGGYSGATWHFSSMPVGQENLENFAMQPSQGHRGGCVVSGTQLLTPSGYVLVQTLAPGSKIMGYNFTTGALQTLTLLWANSSTEQSYLVVNHGLLSVTLTDQPIYVLNSTFEGWLRDPQNLTVGDWLFDPVASSWIEVTSLAVVHHSAHVYDVVTSGPNDFIADGVLLDIKP